MKKTFLLLSLMGFLSSCQMVKSPYELPKPAAGPGRPGDDPNFKPTAEDYENINKFIIQPKCIRCHSEKDPNRKPEHGVALDSYELVKMNLVDIEKEVSKDKMPPKRSAEGTLPARQKEFVLKWIEKGAPEKVVTSPPAPPPSTPAPGEPSNPTEPGAPSEPGQPPSQPGNPAEPGNPDPVSPPTTPAPPSEPEFKPTAMDFDNVNRLIIQMKCIRCHSVHSIDRPPENDVAFDSYQDLKWSLQMIVDMVSEDRMPPKGAREGQLSPQQKDFLLKWIAIGAPEKAEMQKPDLPSEPVNQTQPPSQVIVIVPDNPEPEPIGKVDSSADRVSYSQIQEALFKPKCLECHNSKKAKGDFIIENYDQVADQITDIRAVILDGSMPPARAGGPLSKELKDLFLKWWDAGNPKD